MKRATLPCLMLACGLAAAQSERHDRVMAVPAPRTVTVDGDLGEWDLSGAIDSAFDEALRPKFSLRFGLMYDAKALYVAARVVDDTPLRNRHDPAVEPDKGWAGDALQVRLCSDPDAAYPLPGSNSHRICHLTLWRFTDKKLPVLHVQYGMDYHGTKVLTGKQSGLAFQADPDGKGYVLEGRIPWTLLNAGDSPPKANDRVALVIQPLWSDGSGWKQVCTYNDVIRHAGFSFQGTAMWGQAVFSPRGNLAPSRRPRTVQEAMTPLTLGLPLPDPAARSLSAAVVDADGTLVRTLPVTTLEAGARRRSVELRWDGLDDDGRPLPPGQYQVKMLSHRGVGQRWVTSLHSAGNPPWRTDDGTGGWGGDHGPPIAACSDGERVYLGWTISEAGWAVVGCRKEFGPGKTRTRDGVRTSLAEGQKLWGQHQVLDLGILVTAMATDGERLFVAQDGKRWGQKNPKTFTAGVVLWDAKTGKPVNFPFGKRALVASEWKVALRPERPPLWEAVRKGDVGPQDTRLNLVGIAVAGDTLFVSLRLEDRVAAFNWRTGKKLRDYAILRPAGLAAEKDGSVLVVSDDKLLRLDPASGKAAPVVVGLSGPWDVATGPEDRLYVTDCGEAMQVKVFDPQGKPLRTMGKAGGRPWVGRFEAQGLLKPSGITVDADGKVWVCEHDNSPRRITVWRRDATLLAHLLGPGAYAVEGFADLQRPRWVNVHATLFDVDYETGQAKTLATLTRPNLTGLQFGHDGGNMGRALKFRHLDRGTFVVHTGRGAVLVYRLDEETLVCHPLFAMGDTGHMRFHLPQSLRDDLGLKANQTIRWVDRNGDTFVQKAEIDVEPIPTTLREYWGPWVDEDLSFWNHRGNEIYHVAVREWLPNGVPVYPKTSEQSPLFETLGDQVHYVMPDGDSVYVLEQRKGDARGKGAEWMAISRYALDGTRQWAYRNVWLGFGLEAPLATPGDVVGAMKFIGKARLDDGPTLVAVNGYFGQFNVLSDEGLWVASLCKDNRYGPPAGPNTVWPENFSGWFFRHRGNGKVYLIAGDTDARIWEITGLETIRTAITRVSLSEADHKQAVAAAMRRQGVSTEIPPIRLTRDEDVKVDGDLGDWDMASAVT
ncbi:MAG: FlgD immunoglobulin-like domain containing protein, partial [Planctomycetota bacterium]